MRGRERESKRRGREGHGGWVGEGGTVDGGRQYVLSVFVICSTQYGSPPCSPLSRW